MRGGRVVFRAFCNFFRIISSITSGPKKGQCYRGVLPKTCCSGRWVVPPMLWLRRAIWLPILWLVDQKFDSIQVDGSVANDSADPDRCATVGVDELNTDLSSYG